jgi:hypothetical protein
MGVVCAMEVRSRAPFSRLLISNRDDSMAYPRASERRLQRVREERNTSWPVVRLALFRAQLRRAIDAPQICAASPLQPATHPNAEVANTKTSSPALIDLLRAFFKLLAIKTLLLAIQSGPKMWIGRRSAPRIQNCNHSSANRKSFSRAEWEDFMREVNVRHVIAVNPEVHIDERNRLGLPIESFCASVVALQNVGIPVAAVICPPPTCINSLGEGQGSNDAYRREEVDQIAVRIAKEHGTIAPGLIGRL